MPGKYCFDSAWVRHILAEIRGRGDRKIVVYPLYPPIFRPFPWNIDGINVSSRELEHFRNTGAEVSLAHIEQDILIDGLLKAGLTMGTEWKGVIRILSGLAQAVCRKAWLSEFHWPPAPD